MKRIYIFALAVAVSALACFISACEYSPQSITGYDAKVTSFSFERPALKANSFGLKYHNGVGKTKDNDGNWLYIEPNGEPLPYDLMFGFVEDLCIVSEDSKYGIINANYNEIFEPQFDSLQRVSFSYMRIHDDLIPKEDLFYAKKDGAQYIIDFSTGNLHEYKESYRKYCICEI